MENFLYLNELNELSDLNFSSLDLFLDFRFIFSAMYNVVCISLDIRNPEICDLGKLVKLI